MSEFESDVLTVLSGKRERSPSFPYLDLETSIELARKMYLSAKANEVRIADIAEPWGLTKKSGSLSRYVAALGQFGLIESIGSGEQRRIKISPAGRRIIEDDRPGVREELVAYAALEPKVIRELFEGSERVSAWGHDRPIDSIAESTLKFDLNFTSEAARKLLSVYDETIRFLPKAPTKASETHNDEVATIEVVEDRSVSDSPARHSTVEVRAVVEEPSELNQINFKSEGDGVISISARLDRDGLEILRKKLDAFSLLLAVD